MNSYSAISKYFTNTSWLFAERVLRMSIGFVVGVWVAKFLGPEQFGIYVYVQSFVALFLTISTLGLEGVVLREILKGKDRVEKIIGTAISLRIIGALFMLLIMYLATFFTSDDSQTNLYIFIVGSAAIFQSFNIIDSFFQSKVISKYPVYINSATLLLSSLAKVILVLNESELILFIWLIFFDSVIIAMGLIYFFTKINKISSLKKIGFKKNIVKDLLNNSWPLIIGAIGASIYMKIDQVMIKNILGNEEVGYYAVAAALSNIWLSITVIINKSFLPAILNAKEKSEKIYILRLQNLYNLLIKIGFLISIPFALFSFEIVEFIYSKDYLNSVPILSIYIWSIVFAYLSNISTSYFLAENLKFHASARLILGALINVFLNYFLILEFGILGAAYGTLIAYFFSSYFYNFLFAKTRNNFQLQTNAFINIFNLKSYNLRKILNETL